MTDYFEKIKSLVHSHDSEIKGYTNEELSKIESLYGVIIKGELREFLLLAGRCDGGLLGGDDPIILYRESWNARTHILFQLSILEALQEVGAWAYINKPFVFSLVSENTYYYLMTESDDENVFMYSEISRSVSSTGIGFMEYLNELYNKTNIVCRKNTYSPHGDLLRI